MTGIRRHDVAERQLHNLVDSSTTCSTSSRISSGKINLKKRSRDAATVVAQAVESVRPFIEARGHELTVSSAPVRCRWKATRPGWNRFSQTC